MQMGNHSGKNPSATILKYVFLVIAAVMILASANVQAATVTVGCVGAPAGLTYPTITAALATLNPSVPNTITVQGTCTNQDLQIIGFNQLTIQAPGGSVATIEQDQTPCDTSPSPPHANLPALTIIDSHQIILRRLVIRGGSGVSIDDSSVTALGVTVEGSRASAIRLNNASMLTLSGGATPNFIQDNCSTAIAVSLGSTVSLVSHNTIRNNLQGLLVSGRANLTALPDAIGSAEILIEFNQQQGVIIEEQGRVDINGQVILQNNATNPVTTRDRAAVIIGKGGTLNVNGSGLRIMNNNGPGIWAYMLSKVQLGPLSGGANITITGNGEEGLRLTQMSVGWSFAGSTISGNTGADATCDKTSLLFGDVSGISVIKCAHTERDAHTDRQNNRP